jgi:hypothetical protein
MRKLGIRNQNAEVPMVCVTRPTGWVGILPHRSVFKFRMVYQPILKTTYRQRAGNAQVRKVTDGDQAATPAI